MKTVVVVLLTACIAGSIAQDCSAKFKAFHQCVKDSHQKGEDGRKAKFEALKAKLDACYTSNGCTPPAKGDKGNKGKGGDSDGDDEHPRNKTGGGECRKAIREAMKQNFETCIKQNVPGFVFPPKDGNGERHGEGRGHGHGGHGWNHKDDNKALEGCAAKQAVRDCKRALFNSSRPTEAEKKAMFQARCDAKQKCSASLGAECQAQREKFEKAACQCRQQQRQQVDQIRASVKACQGVQDRQGGRGPRKDQKQETCGERKDYCKLGYDAFVADHPFGQRKGGSHH